MRLIKISLAQQQLSVYEDEKLLAQFSVSTARNGAGQEKNSECTPVGLHEIAEKIGADAPLHAVFKGRKFTGEIYNPELAAQHPNRDWVLTRILWLNGLEPGINQGGNVDSKNRYIYIHGTPKTRPMGEPHSHGCITLHSADMAKLFELVEKNDKVLIT